MKSFFRINRKKRPQKTSKLLDDSTGNIGRKALNEKLLRLEKENEQLQLQLDESKSVVRSLVNSLSGYALALPVLKDLNTTAESKTEKAVLAVTSDIFDISGKSSDLGTRISKILGEAIMGDKGLNGSIGNLTSVNSTIDTLNSRFSLLSKDFSRIIDNFQTRMKDISEYLSNIVDLAEETNVLAINTAIEAARMGKDAGGFAVISDAIQDLSGRSRGIAGTIDDMIKDVNSIIKKSFNDFSLNSLEFGKIFEGINVKLNNISGEIKQKSIQIEESIRETEKLPETIKNDLHGVIEELQFQDITRQIQQHIVEIVEDLNRMSSRVVSNLGVDNLVEERELSGELIELMKQRFTVAEEWDVIGMSIPDSKEDVTLF